MARYYFFRTALLNSNSKIRFFKKKFLSNSSKFSIKICNANIWTIENVTKSAAPLSKLWNEKCFSVVRRYYSKVMEEVSAVNSKESSLKSSFQQMLNDRKKQAACSVLLSLSNKNDMHLAVSRCREFGNIMNVYSYSVESKNIFLLLEFTDEESARNLLLNCQSKNIIDAFPVFSRMIQFEKKYDREISSIDTNILDDTALDSSKSRTNTVSELIEDIYSSEKVSELNTRLRYFFCIIIKESISGLFPYCDVLPFGSSVNGLGRHGADLDVMIRLYPEQVKSDAEFFFLNKTCIGDLRALQQKTIFAVGDVLRTFLPGVASVHKILQARMPILKLKHKILGMDCDISVNNMSAVLMSEMIYFLGEIDPRVRPLIYSVKKWAKEACITYESPGSWITNFGLTLLVIFFLQNRPNSILPPLIDAISILGEESSLDYRLEYLKPLVEWQDQATMNKEPLALLLKDFLTFLGSYSFKNKHISILTGLATEGKHVHAMWIQYPMEEDMNVTKNISEHELVDMCEKARASAKYLASNLNYKVIVETRDLAYLLGIPHIRKLDGQKPRKIDVSLFIDDQQARAPKKEHSQEIILM